MFNIANLLVVRVSQLSCEPAQNSRAVVLHLLTENSHTLFSPGFAIMAHCPRPCKTLLITAI